MTKRTTKTILPDFICYLMLAIYLVCIVFINFSALPQDYRTDMYADMYYAVEAWNQKTIFPEGWVFGNQLYAVATPVLAALFYGLTGDPRIGMAIASTIMAFGVIASFIWMLKPVVSKFSYRCLAAVILLSVCLIFSDPVFAPNGWQLLFTMCTYYACYGITCFLGLGCYLRSDSPLSKGCIAVFLLSCLLSLGTGIQSLRQTAVFHLPLLALELILILLRIHRKEKPLGRSTLLAAALFACNLIGILYSKAAHIPQVQMIDRFTLVPISSLAEQIKDTLFHVFDLFLPLSSRKLLILTGVFVCLVLLLGYGLYRVRDRKGLVCLSFFVISICGLLVLDTFTTMFLRNIYYFMLFPLIGCALFLAYARFGPWVRAGILLACIALICFQLPHHILPEVQKLSDGDRYEEVAQFLLEEDITTVYAGWEQGEEIAISSDWKIQAGFWDSEEHPFSCVKYLCNPEIYHTAPEHCAYIFMGKKATDSAIAEALSLGQELTLLRYFPKSDVYVCTAPVNLMY